MTENGIQWHTTDLPHSINLHCSEISCLCKIKDYGYGVRHWNIKEQCWYDEECDNYYCSLERVEKWCYLDELIEE